MQYFYLLKKEGITTLYNHLISSVVLLIE
jgi:hypothetical protein